MTAEHRRSLHERAAGASSALLLGCGGGGDVIQSLPIARYLQALGVDRIVLAGLGGKWWGDTGLRFGCEVLDLAWLTDTEEVGPHAHLVSPLTTVSEGRGRGRVPHESVLAREKGLPVAMLDLRAGLPGLRAGLASLAERFEVDLVIVVDIGADSFYTGTETTVMSPLLDAMSMAAAVSLDPDAVFALTGYGCDAELPISLLHRNVGLAMSRGGFLGAYGLTQADAAELEAILENFPQADIERRPYRAARGELGVSPIKRFFSTEVLPLAAIYMLFALDVLVDEVNPLPGAIAETGTLAAAEQVVLEAGLFPETRMPGMIEAPTSPQVPDGGAG
jgi:hypothetical protein